MVIVRLSGGMGNQMFQYALGRKISLKYGTSLKLDIDMQEYLHTNGFKLAPAVFRSYALDVFTISAMFASRSEIPFWLRNYGSGKMRPVIDGLRRRLLPYKGREKKEHHFDPSVLDGGPDIYLDGNWQTPKYFSDIQDVLRNDFKLKDPLLEKTRLLQNEIVQCSSVCIHVRRGDYVGNKFHDTSIGQQYYDKGLEYLSSKVTIDKLYVFSDDIAWCKENLTFKFPVLFVDNEYAEEKARGHFALMSSCRHFIIPNSTFSWWAAWLATAEDKTVIAPKKWFPDESIDTSDLIPDSWVRI